MARRKKAGGSVRSSGRPQSHRKQKISTRRVLQYFFSFLGDQLYYLGASVERSAKNTWRSIRKGTRRFGMFLGRVLGAVFGFFWRAIVGVFNDLTNPFRKAFRGLRSLRTIKRETRGKGREYQKMRRREFIRYGWMWNKHVIKRFFNYIVPMAAVGLCAVVVYNMLTLNYALAVNYNGHTVGYVADEQVYDAAQKIIQGRIVYGQNDPAWTADAQLSIAVVDSSELYSQDRMADSLLAASGTEITPAVGLYVGGEFYGATAAGDLLDRAVESVIQPYRDAITDENTEVRFAREVELVEGIYPETSVLPFEELEQLVTSSEETDIYYTVQEGETASGIANKNGLTLDALYELNPEIDPANQPETETQAETDQDEQDADAETEESGEQAQDAASGTELVAGQQLLVARGEKLLGVKTVTREVTIESIAYDQQVVPDSRFSSSYSRVIIEGQEGQKQVTVEIEYEEGVEVSRRVVEEVILVSAVNERRIVGTRQSDFSGIGGGQLSWPTGSPYMISRGWTSYHMAIDIAGQIGLGIYAADTGTVIVAEPVTINGYGLYIIIDHGNGIETLYAHNSQLLVNVGDTVQRGQLIALMGSTGNSTGPHCHFEVRIDGNNRVDPAPYLGIG